MSLVRSLFGDFFASPPPPPASAPNAANPSRIGTSSATRSVADITDRPQSNRQYYKSLSGDVFCFLLHAKDGAYRVYIQEHPSYAGRNAGLHETHRIPDSVRNLHYICYQPDPKTMYDAMMVAAKWADNTSLYIRHGTRF